MNDQFLNRFHKPPRKAFVEALYERISAPMPKRNVTLRRLALGVGAAAVLLALTLLVSPAKRAYAQDVLRQIGLYQLVPGERPPRPNAPAGLPDPTSTPASGNPARITTVEEAAAAAGFAAYVPAYLPAGCTFQEASVMKYINEQFRLEGIGIYIHYACGEDFIEVLQAVMYETQPRLSYTGETEIQDVTVNGRPGVWMIDIHHDLPDDPFGGRLDELWWEQDGFYLAVQTTAFPLEEILRIAESLAQ